MNTCSILCCNNTILSTYFTIQESGYEFPIVWSMLPCNMRIEFSNPESTIQSIAKFLRP